MNLFFVNGPDAGKTVELSPPEVTIGREIDNTISILNSGLSRYHAQMQYVNNAWMIRDLHSTNGTTLNNMPVTDMPMMLRVNDVLAMGEQIFKLIPSPSDPIMPDATEPVINLSGIPPAVSPVVPVLPPIAAPIPTPVPAPEAPAMLDLSQLNSDVLFGEKKPEPPKNEPVVIMSHKLSRRTLNIIFAAFTLLLMIAAAVIVVRVLQSKNRPLNVNTERQMALPLTMRFEHQKVLEDQLLRCELRIDLGHTATLKIYDSNWNVRFEPPPVMLKVLPGMTPEEIRAAKIYEQAANHLGAKLKKLAVAESIPAGPVPTSGNYYYASVCYDRSGFELFETTQRPSENMAQIEEYVSLFSEEVFSLPLDRSFGDLRTEADRRLSQANDLLRNYTARPQNLKEAIRLYRYAISVYELFAPDDVPQINQAIESLNESRELRNKSIGALRTQADAAFSRQDYTEALQCQKQVLEHLDDLEPRDSELLGATRRNIDKISSIITGQGRGR